ncbi:MAG: PH domain-containing protein [Planctomycetota bacterium]
MNEITPPNEIDSADDVIATAAFDEKVCQYWLLNTYLLAVVTVIGIPLIPLIVIFGGWITRKYLQTHSLVLGRRELRLRKGLLTVVEKTIPLEKITDVGYVQGPIMRMMNIDGLSVETAGQSAVGSLMNLQGVVEARAFRDRVLAQRDRISDTPEPQNIASQESVATTGEVVEVLREIQQSLERIEAKMDIPSS